MAGKIVPLLKCLPCKQEDLSSSPPNKKLLGHSRFVLWPTRFTQNRLCSSGFEAVWWNLAGQEAATQKKTAIALSQNLPIVSSTKEKGQVWEPLPLPRLIADWATWCRQPQRLWTVSAVTVLSLEGNISQPCTPFWDRQTHIPRSGSTKLFDSHCYGTRCDLCQQHLYVRIKFPPWSWSSLWWNLSLFAHFFFNFMPFFPNPIRSLSIFCAVVQASSFWNYPVFQIVFFFFLWKVFDSVVLSE